MYCAVAPLVAALAIVSSSLAFPGPSIDIETRSLDQLYDLAVAEGGQLFVRAGGDEKNQQNGTAQAFSQRFPKMNITITVDLSKVKRWSTV